MTLSELIAELIDLEIDHGRLPVLLCVGGDGAIHEGDIINVEVYDYKNGLEVIRIGEI